MRYIDERWRDYFQNHHEGLGTTYERFILFRYFEKLDRRHSVQDVLEVPSFGMTGISGINSMWWAQADKRVTIIDHHEERICSVKDLWREFQLKADFLLEKNGYSTLPFKDQAFDLSWSFAALGLVSKPLQFLSELARTTRKVIFICLPNRSNVFRLLSMFTQQSSDPGLSSEISTKKIKSTMTDLDWRLDEEGYLDVPPWPDIAMKKEDLFEKIGLAHLAKRLQPEEQDQTCILDYFSGKNRELLAQVLKYDVLENAPQAFKKIWAHHHYLIFSCKPLHNKP